MCNSINPNDLTKRLFLASAPAPQPSTPIDPMQQLTQYLQSAGCNGGAGLDPRMLRRMLSRLDRQIVEQLLRNMGGGMPQPQGIDPQVTIATGAPAAPAPAPAAPAPAAPAPAAPVKVASPLAFDLDGDGKVSTTAQQNGRKFDLDGDGKIDQTAWAGQGDGVLAFGDGANGKQLLGNNTDVDGDGKADGYANGFDALKALAKKHLGEQAIADGKLDGNELAQLEQKVNLHMDVGGRKKSVRAAGVKEIELGYQQAGRAADENGNEHRQQGSFTDANGRRGKVNDVWFKYGT